MMKRDVKQLVAQMTLEEKAGLCSGLDFWHTKSVDRLGVPSVMMTDGPHGLRKQMGDADHLGLNTSVEAVCFPAACATASSFDMDLIRDLGDVLGRECQAENVSVLLGPAVNIKRSPLCGRNFEYMSEDPYLTGKLAAAYIQGVQGRHVGTSIKHFAANNQEYNRMGGSSQVSERALREIYLPGFEEAVKASQPKTVMCSYNKINGVYASENDWLLNQVLRKEWGFQGYVVTDWGAVADRVKGIKAGLDLEMPASGGYTDAEIVAAVKDGSLDEAVLDRSVERMLTVLFDYVDNRDADAVFDRAADHKAAEDMAAECAVLLANDGLLPLDGAGPVAYIGEFAAKPRYQGGGSSHIASHKVSSALASAQAKKRAVSYVPAFSCEKDELMDGGLEQAVVAAKAAEVAVIFAGLPDSFESEGYDRTHMRLPDCQNQVIEAVAAANPNTVVVLHNGSPVECPWADKVRAVLEMYLGGEGVGEACDRLLWGEANPCGRLAETFPLRLQDNPSYLNFPGDGKTVHYAEDVFVGYRWYEARQIPVRWAFGHGLSYTSFAYSELRLSSATMDDNGTVTVSVDVTNTGDRAGKEVVQLYVSDRTGTPMRPVKELKGFAKVALEPGETKTVDLTICARDLSYWNSELGDWFAAAGSYALLVGPASDAICRQAEITFRTGKQLPLNVTDASTISQLRADPRTAPLLEKLLAAGAETSGINLSDSGTSDFIEAVLNSVPLKSLRMLFPDVKPEQIRELIASCNALG